MKKNADKKASYSMGSMPRREFMQWTGGAMVASSFPSAVFASNSGAPLIDSHCHAWSSDLSRYPMAEGRSVEDLKPTDVSAASLLDRQKAAGVSKIVLVQHIWYHGWDSSYLTDSAKAMPGHFAVVGAVGETNPDGPDLMIDKKAEGVKGFRVRGFGTVDWVESPVMNKMFEVAAAENLNICPLIRNNANMDDDALLHIAALCEKHPDTTVSIDHMGTVKPGDSEQLRRLLALAEHPNVYVKVSGFNKFDVPPYTALTSQINALIEAYGADRLMWGSDLPVLEYGEEHSLDAAFALANAGLNLSDEDRAWLMGGTAEKVFF